MKKRIGLVSVVTGLLASMVLFGCAGEQTPDVQTEKAEQNVEAGEKAELKSAGKRYVITNQDRSSVTTYTVDPETNRTTRSVVSRNNSDEVITRSYIYSDSGELAEVRSTNTTSGTSIIKYSVSSGRADNKKTKKSIYITGTRGDTDLVEVEYIYDDDGTALGVIQRDSNGNIYEKGLME